MHTKFPVYKSFLLDQLILCKFVHNNKQNIVAPTSLFYTF